jgi:Spy/CpxP family protein refolding chaperone
MKTRILSLALIAIMALSTNAMAQNENGRKRCPEQKEMMMKRKKQMKQRFDNFFTAEQKEQIKELRLAVAKQVKPLKNELNELNAKQKTLTTADKADMNAINNGIDKISATKTQIAKIMAAHHQNVRSMLSEEQLLKFDAMKNQRGKKHGKMRGHGPRGENMPYGKRS